MNKLFVNLRNLILLSLVLLTIVSCGPWKKHINHPFPEPIDTTTKPIAEQTKKTYQFPRKGLYVSNEFDGARVNDCKLDADGNIVITITAENTPINNSAYFGFKIWADDITTANIILDYPEYNHRYIPKLSIDRIQWTPLTEDQYQVNEDKTSCTFEIEVGPKPMFVCAQELNTSKDVQAWSEERAKKSFVQLGSYGKSKLGRNLPVLDVYEGEKKGKDCIIIVSRQHPPELSGYFAMQAFVDVLLEDSMLSKAYRQKYRTIVMPILNPDGVDLGHWRHSAGGIDLNRDWSKYNQPEIKQATEYMVEQTNKFKNDVLIGLDFHSTQNDIYYTLSDDLAHDLEGFREYWIAGIGQAFEGTYEPNDAPSPLSKPISKGWFYLQFNAEGITYEVGDETPRDFIKAKGEVAAKEMMKMLVYRD